jgi:hypothetical protein
MYLDVHTRKELIAHLDRLKIGYSILPLEATKNGAVQPREDARRYARHFREERESIDGLVICLPNFGDEIAITELINEARLNIPILLQASNDEIDKVDVHSRRDAFCGKFSVTNNFYQYGVRFTDTTSHTSDIGGEEFGSNVPRRARTAACANWFDRRAHWRIPDDAIQREALAGLRPHSRHCGPFGDHLRRQRAWRRRAGSQGETRGNCGLRTHSGPYQAREDRPSGQMDHRGRSLD